MPFVQVCCVVFSKNNGAVVGEWIRGGVHKRKRKSSAVGQLVIAMKTAQD